MYLMVIYLLVFIVQLSLSKAESESFESILSDKYDSYGDDWIFMPDGNNNLQVAVLKGEAIEPRGSFDVIALYKLYTRSHIEDGIPLYLNDSESINNSDFSAKRPTKFITHGWKSSGCSSGPINLKDAYLEKGDYNIIIVDWESLASNTFYLGPMRNTRIVGADAAAFIDFLCTITHADPEEIHFLGHSLGAHVAGNAGSLLTVGKLGRVTALDPALPGFHGIMAVERLLNENCAIFVDVIHTCGGILGFFDPIGHVDFYPNGGVPVQRGCCCIPEMMDACSHGRSYAYFTESINSKVGLLATKCDSWVKYSNGFCANSSKTYLGEFVDRSSRGLYYLNTGSTAPFAIWHAD